MKLQLDDLFDLWESRKETLYIRITKGRWAGSIGFIHYLSGTKTQKPSPYDKIFPLSETTCEIYPTYSMMTNWSITRADLDKAYKFKGQVITITHINVQFGFTYPNNRTKQYKLNKEYDFEILDSGFSESDLWKIRRKKSSYCS